MGVAWGLSRRRRCIKDGRLDREVPWGSTREIMGRHPPIMAMSCMAVAEVGCYPRRYRRHLAVPVRAAMCLAVAMEMNAALLVRAIAAAGMEVG